MKLIQKKKGKITVYAHRGYSTKYPENTLLAFQKAIELGADFIELDVRKTKDNQLVIMHDATIKRMAKKDVLVSDTTLSELKQYRLDHDQQIPTLREVFELCKGKIDIEIELKEKGIWDGIYSLIKEFDMGNNVHISSFHQDEIRKIKKKHPELFCSVAEPSGIANKLPIEKAQALYIKRAKKNKIDAIHVNQFRMEEDFIKMAHDAGFYVSAWAVDEPSQWEFLIVAGIDGIFTNNCEGLLNYLKTRKD